MDKKQALKILIGNSRLLRTDGKNKLLTNVDSMPETDLANLGKFFAYEMQANIDLDPDFLNKIQTSQTT